MNRKFSKLVIVAILLATNSLSVPAFATNARVDRGTEVAEAQSKALLPTIQIKGQTLIPLRAYLKLVGINEVIWQPVHTPGTYAKLTIEAPAQFIQAYHNNLERGLGGIYGNTIEPLPKALEGIVAQEEHTQLADEPSLQEKAIEMTINSEGSSTGYVFYNYANNKGTLYVPPMELKPFGLVELEQLNDTQARISFRTQQQIKQSYQAFDQQLQDALMQLTPDEVITTWIRAQQARCGALQYVLLCAELQQKVLPEIKQRGWVTGGSSPTLRGGKVKVEQLTNTADQVTYKIQLESMLQEKVYEKLEQIVTVSKIEGRWCITKVSGADGYYNYENLKE